MRVWFKKKKRVFIQSKGFHLCDTDMEQSSIGKYHFSSPDYRTGAYLELKEKAHYWKMSFLLKVTTFLDHMRHFGSWRSVYFGFELQSGSEVLPISMLSSTQSFVAGIGVRELVPGGRNRD